MVSYSEVRGKDLLPCQSSNYRDASDVFIYGNQFGRIDDELILYKLPGATTLHDGRENEGK